MLGSFGACAALLPGSPSAELDRACRRFLIYFSRFPDVVIWNSRAVAVIMGRVLGRMLALGVTMGCPSFPDGYAFSWPGASLWIQFVFVHKLDSWGGARLWRGVLIFFGGGRLMVSFSASSWPGILLT